jgi:hypothetical protein
MYATKVAPGEARGPLILLFFLLSPVASSRSRELYLIVTKRPPSRLSSRHKMHEDEKKETDEIRWKARKVSIWNRKRGGIAANH